MLATEISQTNGHLTALTVTPKSALAKLQQLREELEHIFLDYHDCLLQLNNLSPSLQDTH